MVSDAAGRRLLVVTRDLALLRGHYEDVLALLATSGVAVRIRYLNEQGLTAESFASIMRARGAEVFLEPLARPKRGAGDRLALRLRQLTNLLRFSHPDYRNRDWLREIKFVRAAPGPRRWAERLGRTGASGAAMRVASYVDGILPPAKPARDVVAAERPDAVVAVPVIRTPEFVDYLKAGSWQGIPTASWIQSWDNLSSKGLLHFRPDRVFVWNSTQKDELARYHGIPEGNVCVTGAQTFDHWFGDEPASTREDFCARNGLDPALPIVLYLASSRQLEPPPGEFFARWLAALRSSGDPALAGASVLARPHPTDVDPWLELALDEPLLAISPGTAEAPINSPEFRRRYRDELHHASVAVALNTSGMIDAAIFGKPVCTIELPEFAFGQRGTIHFEYLSTVGGGLLHTAPSLDEHVAQLEALIGREPSERDERSDRFVRAFIRPHGLDVRPSEVFAAEMLRLLREPSAVSIPGPAARSLGRIVHGAAPILGAPLEDGPRARLWWDRRRKSLARDAKELRRRRARLRKRLRKLERRWRSRALRGRRAA